MMCFCHASKTRRPWRLFFLVMLFSQAVASAMASDGDLLPLLSYKDACERFRSESFDLKAAYLTRNASKDVATGQIVSSFVPSVSVSSTLVAAGTPQRSGISGWDWNSSSYPDVGASLSLGVGSSIVTNVIGAGMQKRMADYTFEQTQANLEAALFAAYYGLSSADEALASAQRALEASERALEDVQARFDAGLCSSLELANAKLALEGARQSAISARQSRASAYLSLKGMLNFDDYDFSVERIGEFPFLDFPDIQRMHNRYLSANSTLRSLALSKDLAAENAIAADLGSRLPNFTVSAGYGYRGQRPEGEYPDGGFSFSVSGRWALDGFIPYTSAYAGIKSAHASAQVASLELEKGYLTYRNELESRITQIESLEGACVAAQSRLSLASESLRLAKEAFENGRVGFQDYLDALNAAFSAEVSLLASRLGYQNAVYSLSVYLGQDYDEFVKEYAREGR